MTFAGLRMGRSFPLIAAVTLCAVTGCASSTVLQTTPPGATVSINGFVVGQTPYTLRDKKIVGSSTQLRFEYPGYEPYDVMLFRNEKVDVLPLIGGVVLVPLLWVMKYRPHHDYELRPLRSGDSGPQDAGHAPASPQPPESVPPQAPPPPPSGRHRARRTPLMPAPAPAPAPAPTGPAGYPPPPPGYPPPAQ